MGSRFWVDCVAKGYLTPRSEPQKADIRPRPRWLYRVEPWSLYRVEN